MASFSDNFNQTIDPGLLNALGDDVSFKPSGGAAVLIKGVFDEEYYQANAGSGVETYSPAVWCHAVDVPGVDHTSQIINGATTYNVINVQPDGTGMVVLILQLP